MTTTLLRSDRAPAPTGRGRPRSAGAPGARAASLMLLVGVVLCAAVVALLDTGLFNQADQTRGHRTGDDVKTSFGVVAVEYVRSVDGVTDRALAGASHGVSGLVDASHAQIQAAVALTNRSGKPISYTSTQFTLLVTVDGKTTSQVPTGGDLPNMRILPNAGIEGHLDFTVPRKPVHLSLQFADPGSSTPILIDLGGIKPSPAVSDPHSHG